MKDTFDIIGGMTRKELEAEVAELGGLSSALNRDVRACRTELVALQGTQMSPEQRAHVERALEATDGRRR